MSLQATSRGGKNADVWSVGKKPRPPKRAARFLAVDPGDVHVGLAEFEKVDDGPWLCVWAGEKTPEQFLPWLAEGLRGLRWLHLVVEEWRLFPQAAPIYVGSDMPTSRLIGSIEALAQFLPPDEGWFDEPVPVYLQTPQIKTPTRGYLKKRKLRSTAKVLKVSGDHASDAELHGFKWLIDHPGMGRIANSRDQADALRPSDLTGSHAVW